MKARDLTPACIGRQIKVERVRPVEGKLTRIAAEKDVRGYLYLYVTIGGSELRLRGEEPVTITG